ncbi:peptidoglycan-binding protein LysM [Christiangramia fulva]|uniref:Peptidoglycan-binding protein LysM n=1 Tax=Christiangramia fulva TaxID=2126553 RepID=A0A2R3Z6P3_9FLAO|nr:LysM peptidoglycan-binding domain-containing protein [Christiangramia fulva]AVR45872.1 peptidoglycan-binding protein LysM [Christiangramia fulva]
MRYLFVICFLLQFYVAPAFAQAYKYHTVKKGETVFSISQAYNIDEEDIYKYNPDARNGIEINEKLVIPISGSENKPAQNVNIDFKEHVVQRKETLYSLSKQYNVSIDEIKKYNKQLYSKELQTGETIRIPIERKAEAAQTKPKESILNRNKPSENPAIQTKKTREHIVLPKETKYGIARKYGMTVSELEDLNPNVEVLQPGMMIRVGTDVLKDEPVIITDERFHFYEVKPQETLFSLSQRFGVSQDSLMKLNPGLVDGLKSGMVLKVPEKENPDYDPASAISYNPNLENKIDLSGEISNFKTKQLVLMLPFHTEKVEEDSLATYKDVILNERVVRISLDFYSGVLMALNKAKSLGINTDLQVYDTHQNSSEVANIINTHNFNNVDVVIGPLIQTTTEIAASKLENRNIPVINPLSNSSMNGYRNLFQSRPTDELLRKVMLDYISSHAEGKNIIIIADGKSYQVKNQLSQRLPSAKFVNPTDNFVADNKIVNLLQPGLPNWVILESDNINVVSSATSALNRLARDYDITLLTTNKNSAFESDIISNNHLGKLKFHYPSVDREYDNTRTEDFINDYVAKYGIEPNRFALRGYDLTLDILLRLASADSLYDSFERYPGYTEYYESKFHYIPNTTGGFINDAVYILELDEDLTINDAK